MSTTLNLIDRLLNRGRNLQQLGCDREAYQVFRRIARFRELPAEAAEETHFRLAELLLSRRKYRRARQHLNAVLRQQPNNAHGHYLLATAIDAEDTGDPRRAARHYRRSLQLDPHHSDCLTDYGHLHLREGRTEAGLTCLRRAVELSPHDVEAVRRLAAELVNAGQEAEARAVHRTAIFRNPRDARFRQLWNQFQFEHLAREQKAARCEDTRKTTDEEPVILSFVCPERSSRTTRVDSRILRQDGPQALPSLHVLPSSRRFDRRDAQ